MPDSSPPPAPSPATTPARQSVQDQGWTKNDQRQEPELSRDALLRAIDVRVAERVMGWRKRGRHYEDATGAVRTLDLTSFGSFAPSTDIAAAWLVVEKLRERFQRIEVHAVHLHEDAPCYVCMVEAESGTTQEHYVAHAEAETAPLAICHAALRTTDSDAGSVVLAVDPSRSTPEQAEP
jgi:hypothetical protein